MTTQAVESLLAKFPDARQAGKGWSARCPAHEDRHASLSVAEGDDGRALVYCHAGCTVDEICAAVGLRVADLMPPVDPPKRNGKPRIVATYDYCDEAGELQFQVVRYEPKDFRQRRPKAGGGWDWSVKGARGVPYRLPELLAQPAAPVFVVEGEKDVDNLARMGLLATCNACGAGKWTAEHAQYLAGRRLIVLPDNDEPGQKHGQQVAQSSHGIAASLRVIDLPGVPPKGDVSDWIAAGGTKNDLKRLDPTVAENRSFRRMRPARVSDERPACGLAGVGRGGIARHANAGGLGRIAGPGGLLRDDCPAGGSGTAPRLFVAVLLEPGNRKSAVFNDAMRPLRELEAELIETARPTVARGQSERRQSERRLQKLEKKAAEKGDAEARDEAGKLAAELAEQPEPALPRLIVDDATSEKLGMMLAEQGGRIASMSPEGGVFDLMAGLYSKSGIPQFGVYLMGHSGDDLITDRVSRQSVRVERPALTCAYAMQPQVIEGLAENVAFRGRGLLARFLYAAPRSWIGTRQIATDPVSERTREAYSQTVRAMAGLTGEAVLRLTADASAALQAWETEIETMLGPTFRK
ncbi:MAG TPA: DUF3987 domain-containing protein [Pirellulales bacterium]|nr:DUF3987 domain-containing protein [Pirellulales bacterium]